MGDLKGRSRVRERYATYRLRRALAPLLHRLGSRVAALAPRVDELRAVAPDECFLAVLGPAVESGDRAAAGPEPRVVAGPSGLPLLSGALTGLLVMADLGPEHLAQMLREACRLLQPGGRVLLVLARPADGDACASGGALEEFARAADLSLERRQVVGLPRADEDPPRVLFPLALAMERLRARLLGARAAPGIQALLLRRPGGVTIELPDARRMLGGLFVPPRWLDRSGGRPR